MIKVVAENQYYKLHYDSIKNRIYYAVLGFWSSVAVVPNYLIDMDKALKCTLPDFTFLVDVSKATAHPIDVQDIRKKAQAMVKQAGFFKMATIVPSNVFVSFQIETMFKGNKIISEKFRSIEVADRWLDEPK